MTAGIGWWWASQHPHLDLVRDFAGNRLLAPAGIQWSRDGLSSQGYYAVNGPPDELTHAAWALDAVEAHATGRRTLTQSEIDQSQRTLTIAVRCLPADDVLLAPRVQAFLMSDERDRWPTDKHPVGKSDVVARMAATLFVTEHNRTPAKSVRAHPAAADFPGSVPASAPRLTRTLTIDTTEPHGHAAGPLGWPRVPRWHSTGLYAAPGDLVTVTVPARVANGGLFVRVGAHSDGIWGRSVWTRMPEISRRFPISASRTPVANAFGGLIYVEVPVNANFGKFVVEIEGAVAAPLLRVGRDGPGRVAQRDSTRASAVGRDRRAKHDRHHGRARVCAASTTRPPWPRPGTACST